MRVLVCGGRDYDDRAHLYRVLDALEPRPSLIINGAANGADWLSTEWATERGVPVEEYRAKWLQYGKRAGPRRNAEMLRYGKPDVVMAFRGGGGTANMKMQARKARVEVREV